MIVIVMGVCGVGKTEVGALLASRLKWGFIEADSFHPKSNLEKLSKGIPLTDSDRDPWLKGLRLKIEEEILSGRSAVLSCSALKETYRSRLRGESSDIKFVHLTGSRELLSSRLNRRKGHFMNPALLESQLATLEPPTDAITVDVTPPVEEIVEQILSALSPCISTPR